jgi:hypothetical protein
MPEELKDARGTMRSPTSTDSLTIEVKPRGGFSVAISPIEAYVGLLNDTNLTPAQAASAVAAHIPHKWEPVIPPSSGAPFVLQSVWDALAWARFAPDDPIVRQQMGAYVLFSAAAHVTDRNAITVLMDLGRSVISEIVNGWLHGQR